MVLDICSGTLGTANVRLELPENGRIVGSP